jgi:thymidylate kinase
MVVNASRALDVVAATTAHQTNLRPQSAPPRVAVLALPRPYLCACFEAGRFDRIRAAAVAALAAAVGGGEGPALVEDLESPGAPLPERLEALAAAGIDRLVLFGAAERPAFAREISLRFAGGVEAPAAAGLLHRARHAPERVVALGEGLYRLDPGASAPADAEALLWRAADATPPVLPVSPHPQAPLAHDPEARLGAGLGLAPPEALPGTVAGAALRAAWGAAWPADPFRAAVLGLDAALEAAVRAPVERVRPGRPVVAVTGMDGSGKSTHVDHLARALSGAGRGRVAVLKLYRQGAFLALADDLGARTRRGAPLTCFRLSRVVKLWDSLRVLAEAFEPLVAAHDTLVLDRWTETHVAAAESQLGWDLRSHGALARMPEADARAWLLLPPEVALSRLEVRGTPLTADEHATGLAGYAAVFERLAQGARELRLDARAPEAENAARLRAFFGVPPDAPPGAEPTPPPQAPPALPRTNARAEVVLGHDAAWPELGADCARWAAAAGPLTRDFLLEGISTRCLLDLREGRPARACAPLWPGVLARLYPDATALAEVDHLLAHEARVVGYRPPRPADFAGLGGPEGAVRFAAAYGRALETLAGERGWPCLDAAP